MSVYPAQIDDNTSLPNAIDKITGVNAIVVNRLKAAILAIEYELGVKPASIYSTVRARLDALEANGGGSTAPIAPSAGTLITNVTVQVSDYTASSTDCTVGVGTLTFPIVITLPLLPETGRILIIKDISGTVDNSNTVTVNGNGKNIDDSLTQVMDVPYSSIMVQYTGSGWSII